MLGEAEAFGFVKAFQLKSFDFVLKLCDFLVVALNSAFRVLVFFCHEHFTGRKVFVGESGEKLKGRFFTCFRGVFEVTAGNVKALPARPPAVLKHPLVSVIAPARLETTVFRVTVKVYRSTVIYATDSARTALHVDVVVVRYYNGDFACGSGELVCEIKAHTPSYT